MKIAKEPDHQQTNSLWLRKDAELLRIWDSFWAEVNVA